MATPLTPENVTEKLELIGSYILEGMTEKESCILAEISYDDLQIFKENNQDVREWLEKKKIKFKHKHLVEIQTKKGVKESQWLLEKLIPQEFGTKVKTEPTTVNIISQIIQEIQNDTQPIIGFSREARIQSQPDQDVEEPKARIAKLLN